jgi:hypothetical protein
LKAFAAHRLAPFGFSAHIDFSARPINILAISIVKRELFRIVLDVIVLKVAAAQSVTHRASIVSVKTFPSNVQGLNACCNSI